MKFCILILMMLISINVIAIELPERKQTYFYDIKWKKSINDIDLVQKNVLMKIDRYFVFERINRSRSQKIDVFIKTEGDFKIELMYDQYGLKKQIKYGEMDSMQNIIIEDLLVWVQYKNDTLFLFGEQFFTFDVSGKNINNTVELSEYDGIDQLTIESKVNGQSTLLETIIEIKDLGNIYDFDSYDFDSYDFKPNYDNVINFNFNISALVTDYYEGVSEDYTASKLKFRQEYLIEKFVDKKIIKNSVIEFYKNNESEFLKGILSKSQYELINDNIERKELTQSVGEYLLVNFDKYIKGELTSNQLDLIDKYVSTIKLKSIFDVYVENENVSSDDLIILFSMNGPGLGKRKYLNKISMLIDALIDVEITRNEALNELDNNLTEIKSNYYLKYLSRSLSRDFDVLVFERFIKQFYNLSANESIFHELNEFTTIFESKFNNKNSVIKNLKLTFNKDEIENEVRVFEKQLKDLLYYLINLPVDQRGASQKFIISQLQRVYKSNYLNIKKQEAANMIVKANYKKLDLLLSKNKYKPRFDIRSYKGEITLQFLNEKWNELNASQRGSLIWNVPFTEVGNQWLVSMLNAKMPTSEKKILIERIGEKINQYPENSQALIDFLIENQKVSFRKIISDYLGEQYVEIHAPQSDIN
ncbi:hypothetical protein [Marinicellulosiphila megalodicopiae]|uniref:hypothetical protein n=1 Tax=Marinicellulosiphila megalodicopiae TaxID=2724896 RepID=UPI003BB0E454